MTGPDRLTLLPRRPNTAPLVPTELSDDEFEAFRDLIYREAGITLNQSKRGLVVSRLSKRLRKLGLDSYLDYLDLLLTRDPDRDEMQEMINCITTNKTEFYREPHHFDFLKAEGLVELERDRLRSGKRQLRVWSAACSMGHEAYTLAIVLREHFGARTGWDLKILATDIDTHVLTTAQEGIYPLSEIAPVAAAERQRYFLRGRGEWEGMACVKKELKEMIRFRQLNLMQTAWPLTTKFDLIFCRNVLIYFDQATQQKVLSQMARHLSPDGYLFIGHSENMSWDTGTFRPIGGTIYRLRS